MDLHRKVFAVASLLSSTVALAGCSNVGNAALTPTTAPTQSVPVFRTITPQEFDTSMIDFEVKKDEFNGMTFLTSSKFEKLIAAQPMVEKSFINFFGGLEILDGKPSLSVTSYIMAKKWWFHSSIDYKSSTGVFHQDVDPSLRSDVVEDGGTVSETFVFSPVKSEALKLCRVIEGEGLQVKVSPSLSSSHSYAVQTLAPITVTTLRNSCIVYFGLEQGLTTPKIPK